MKSQTKAMVVGSLTAMASLAAPATAVAHGSCYAFQDFNPILTVDGGSPIVLRYIPVNVGSINNDAEARKYAHLKQQAYSLVGKATALIDHNCDANGTQTCPETVPDQFRLMTTVDGTIITGRKLTDATPDAPGAHMGINMHFLRRVPGYEGVVIGPVDMECTSPSTSPTPPSWLCNLRAGIDIAVSDPLFLSILSINTPIILQKVNPNSTPACSVFEDGRMEIVY